MLKKLSNFLFGNRKDKSLSLVGGSTGWNPLHVHEPFAGAWQRNMEVTGDSHATFPAVFACISLISKDMGKMGIRLKKRQKKVLVDARTPDNLKIVMERPNKYQNWQQFNEYWTTCLLLRGNCFIFKVRDVFGNVVSLKILDPDKVTILISDSGDVFYRLTQDKLAQVDNVTIPASEIIHDRINCFFNQLVGMSPIFAYCRYSALAQKILATQEKLFENGARPGGILVAPGPIDNDKAKQLQEAWNSGYGGANVGKTAVLGDGLQYTQLSISAADSQLIEQLKITSEIACSVFHVPPAKIGLNGGFTGKSSDINEIYFSDCIQAYVESRENLLDDGLLLKGYGVEAFLDTNALIRMDKDSLINYLRNGISAGIMSPNEARAEIGLLPVAGGDSPVMQQQNYSLSALAKRDAKEDPFSTDKAEADANGNSNTEST